MALCLRATFIDYEEEVQYYDEADAAPKRSRATTLPLPMAGQVDVDIFDGERAYLSGLSGKMSSIWVTGEARNYGDIRSFFEEAGNSPKSQLEEQMAPVTSLEQQELNGEASDMLLRAKLDEQVAALNDETATRSPSSDGGIELFSDGSLGHPDICARPCLHFAAGHCAHGNSCSFCHLTHTKRPVHLDKKHRDMMQKMPSERLSSLLLPLLREKLVSFDTSEESAEDFDAFLRELGFENGFASFDMTVRPPRADRSLLVACRAMSFRLLLIMIIRVAFKDGATAQAASDALLDKLLRRRGSVA